MTVSEYIALLEMFMSVHGDIPVEGAGYSGRQPANVPRMAYRKVLAKRESRPEFAHREDQSDRGDPVCRIW